MTILVDANILLYAKFSDFSQHDSARAWLDEALSGTSPLGLPWVSLAAFLRISTNAKVMGKPLSIEAATQQVGEWCARRVVWHPAPGERFAEVFTDLLVRHRCSGNVVADAYLAALAAEHGVAVASSDSDFARFKEVVWLNPIADS